MTEDDVDMQSLVRIGGQFAEAAVLRYRAEHPDAFAQLAKAFVEGGAKFDVCIRDITGRFPSIELVVCGAREAVLASQLLRRGGLPGEATPPAG